MNKKVVVNIYNGILLSYKKKCILVSSNEVDEPRAYCTEWSKSEREKQISCMNTYIWNLERWYWWTYLQGSNGDTDIKNRRKDKSGGVEEEGGTNGESNMEAYTLCCELCLVAQSCSTLCNPMDCSLPGSSVHGDSPGKNTGVGCHEIIPTQGSNPVGPQCRWILYYLSHQGSKPLVMTQQYHF